ncbi:hypothetical protein DV711_11935 [Motiliproteus coralliicola]|uniref:Uncharacterized protein n=1 Tax=Motiliproteus coralliicola TaxID=2283196 RepID=A0A369WEK1_9GAMM|nr:hypothetical protein [Motiliproteus coralliicola]RDE19589.1 hypothetical protein DV711_11935 [Motiliproteus coralliicola]
MQSLNLVSLQSGTVHSAELVAEPSLAELNLQGRQDDQRLMIALGQTLGCPRPINPKGISRCRDLLLVWLDHAEVVAIAHPRFGYDLESGLRAVLGDQIEIELIPDTSLHLSLDSDSWKALQALEYHSIDADGLSEQPDSLCVRPSSACRELSLLLQQQDHELFQRWIQQLSH